MAHRAGAMKIESSASISYWCDWKTKFPGGMAYVSLSKGTSIVAVKQRSVGSLSVFAAENTH